MQASRDEREWHLRNVVETTKGRELIRKLYQELPSDMSFGRGKTAKTLDPPLDDMIAAILENEYPG